MNSVIIGEFQIKATSKTGSWNAGSYDNTKKKLKLTLQARQRNIKDVFNTLHHEIGHAWYQLMETSPDIIKKFNETVQEAQKGGGITAYT